MIHTGTDLKFRVKSQTERVNLSEIDFSIVIKNRWGQTVYLVTKENCYQDTNDDWYFNYENAQNGVYYALFSCSTPDEDYDKLERVLTDKQYLVTVGSCRCNNMAEGCECEHIVKYEQVWSVSIEDGAYLCDKDGNPILGSDGKKIYFKNDTGQAQIRLDMTASEVKEMLEGRSEDGKINTVPEVMDALGGINDETELSLMTESDAEEMMDEILNNN